MKLLNNRTFQFFALCAAGIFIAGLMLFALQIVDKESPAPFVMILVMFCCAYVPLLHWEEYDTNVKTRCLIAIFKSTAVAMAAFTLWAAIFKIVPASPTALYIGVCTIFAIGAVVGLARWRRYMATPEEGEEHGISDPTRLLRG